MNTNRYLRAGSLFVFFTAFAACNAITGASDVEFDPEMHGSAGSASGSGGANGASTGSWNDGETSGSGVGSSTATSGVGSTVGAGGANSTASNSSASSVVASSSAASSGSGGAVAWPAGPYGVTIGKTVPESLSWAGYVEGSKSPATLSLQSWYDPDGTKGIEAILVITSQFGCGPCYEEAQTLQGHSQSWKSQGYGIKVLQLVVNDSNGDSADISAANEWKAKFGLVDIAVGADPNDEMAPGGSFGTPLQTLIDPRTMKVIDVTEGFSGDFSDVESLADTNK